MIKNLSNKRAKDRKKAELVKLENEIDTSFPLFLFRVREAEKSVRSRRMSHIDVREEVKGPPVEYGFAEKEEARKLRDWWIDNHGDSQGGASEEAVGNKHSEETDAMES